MDGVLQTNRVSAYAPVFQFYKLNQAMVYKHLKELEPPRQLRVFHQHTLDSLEAQIQFYEIFTAAKIKDPSLNLSKMLRDPLLQKASMELHFAYGELLRLYPDLDAKTRYAINRRLCHSDVI